MSLQILAGLLAISSALMGCFMLLLAILFWVNFHFRDVWHCLVFFVTLMTPLLTLGGYLRYLRRQTWQAFGVSLAGSALIGVTWLMWILPASRGLMH